MGKELAQEELDQILGQYETSKPLRSGGETEGSTSGAGNRVRDDHRIFWWSFPGGSCGTAADRLCTA